MKKLILSLGLLTSISVAAQAQTGVRFGLKAGASLTNVTSSSQDNKFGFNGGGIVNFGIDDMFSIQPEVLYSNKGYKIKGGTNGLRVALNYIDVPVLVKLATGSTGLFFELGPQVGFRLAADLKDNDNSASFKDYTKSVDFGYAAGLGFQVASGPMVGLRYNGGFTKIGKDGNVNGAQVTASDGKNSAFQLYVGFLFGGK